MVKKFSKTSGRHTDKEDEENFKEEKKEREKEE